MFVSVVMTGQDTCRYVDEAIRSVLSSTHRDFELILVDDGSTDPTGEIMDSWARRDGRVRFERQERLGRNAALRRAHEMATGDVLAWVDSDDVIDPDGLDLCVGALDDDHGVMYSHRWLIDADGRHHGSHAKNGVAYSPTRILVSNMVFHLRVFTRDVFDASGGVGELSSAIDWDMNLRMTETTGVRCVPIELYSYRVRPGRMSGTPGQARNAEIAVRNAIARRGLDLCLDVRADGWRLSRPPRLTAEVGAGDTEQHRMSSSAIGGSEFSSDERAV